MAAHYLAAGVVDERNVALGALYSFTALAAEDKAGKTAAVEKENDLFATV